MIEIWKDIEDYSNYQVSNLGRVRNTLHNYYDINTKKVVSKNETRILKQVHNKKGYLMVGLMKNGKQKRMQVHRLVAKTFIPNVENKEQVNHINEIKTDNRVDNLEWCSSSYNINYGDRNNKVAKKVSIWRNTIAKNFSPRKGKLCKGE